VFLTSGNSDPAVLVQSIRAGAKEFFVQPIDAEEVKQALLRLKERRRRPSGQQVVRRGKIVDVVGAKGGVGTTTIAVNLAASLTRIEDSPSVALVDMNLLFGEVPLFLDIESTYHWGEISRNIDRLDATFLMSILSSHSSGVYVLPSPAQLNGSDAVATPETAQRLLGLMRSMFDFIVIDGGQHLNDACLRIFELSDTVLFLSVLSLPCLANLNRLLKSFYGLGHSPEKAVVVVNRYLKNPDVPLEDINKKIRRTIPNDYRTTMSAINQGKTLWEVAPRTPITRSIQELALTLARKEGNEEKKRGLLGSLFKGT
jgi:pilus assembly protein CpaE